MYIFLNLSLKNGLTVMIYLFVGFVRHLFSPDYFDIYDMLSVDDYEDCYNSLVACTLQKQENESMLMVVLAFTRFVSPQHSSSETTVPALYLPKDLQIFASIATLF